MKSRPLDSLERFDIVMAMFPDRLNDGAHDLGDEEEIIYDEFCIEPDEFDKLVGQLVMLAPVMQSALQGKHYHMLGRAYIDGENQHFVAAVKREVQQPEGDNQ